MRTNVKQRKKQPTKKAVASSFSGAKVKLPDIGQAIDAINSATNQADRLLRDLKKKDELPICTCGVESCRIGPFYYRDGRSTRFFPK